MKKIKQFIILYVIFIFILMNFYSNVYATSEKITYEKLKSSFDELVKLGNNSEDYKITVENNQIKIIYNQKNYIVTYDLTNKPTFTYETKLYQGMSYKEFKEKTENTSFSIMGYLAVAKIKGIDYDDSATYIAKNIVSSSFSNATKSNYSKYIFIVDDTDKTKNNIIDQNANTSNVIYESEFGNHVMEYVNSMYSEKRSFNDSDEFNTFEMTMEIKDVQQTSCKLVTTLTINPDADFSKINGYYEKTLDSIENNENNTSDGNTENTENNGNNILNKLPIEQEKKDSINNIVNTKQDNNTTKNDKIPVDQSKNNSNNNVLDTEQVKKESDNNTEINSNSQKIANITVMPKTGKKQNPVLSIVYALIAISIMGIIYLIITEKRK